MRGLTNGDEFPITADHFYQAPGVYNESFSIKVYLVDPETGSLILLTEALPRDGGGVATIRADGCTDKVTSQVSAGMRQGFVPASFLAVGISLLTWMVL